MPTRRYDGGANMLSPILRRGRVLGDQQGKDARNGLPKNKHTGSHCREHFGLGAPWPQKIITI